MTGSYSRYTGQLSWLGRLTLTVSLSVIIIVASCIRARLGVKFVYK